MIISLEETKWSLNRSFIQQMSVECSVSDPMLGMAYPKRNQKQSLCSGHHREAVGKGGCRFYTDPCFSISNFSKKSTRNNLHSFSFSTELCSSKSGCNGIWKLSIGSLVFQQFYELRLWNTDLSTGGSFTVTQRRFSRLGLRTPSHTQVPIGF